MTTVMRDPAVARRTSKTGTWLSILVILVAGCGPEQIRSEKPMDPAMERLLAVGRGYGEFNRERGRPPKGPDDIRGRLTTADAFVSPRDGQPFVIFWGVDITSPATWATGRPILAHESQGADGSRYVLTTMLNVELLPDGELRASSFPPGKKAP